MNSASHNFGSFPVLLATILTPLKLVGRSVQHCMETTILGSSHIGQLMHTKPQDATTCYAQALFKQTIGLQWGQQYLQDHLTMAGNLILPL
nr:hypothetical protein CK203_018523 [Ipomoea batatas]